ncbi:MAG: DUF2950 family protein [Planctomycetota bacterium]|nr:DUF2950 family protein [Planctomycetota bacterium]
MRTAHSRRWLLALLAVVALVAGTYASADEKAAAVGPAAYADAEAASKALIHAAAANDDAALGRIFGSAASDLVMSGKDPVVAKERKELAALAKKRHALRDNPDGSKTLVIGDDDWPLPFPLVKGKDGTWRFDLEAGRDEILARRIGRNEHRAMDICRIYADAQVDYASEDRDGDRVREYARRLRSSEGKQDGLYWPTQEGQDASPLGPLVASWREHLGGMQRGQRVPVGGYYFRILEGQGGAAPGGRHSYVINGNMIAGYAIVAYPAAYGSSGVMTFLFSHHGTMYERDLGRCTAVCVQKMIGFNPTEGWREVGE